MDHLKWISPQWKPLAAAQCSALHPKASTATWVWVEGDGFFPLKGRVYSHRDNMG